MTQPDSPTPIKILHLSDIHLGSGLNHGRINPETGLNSRLEDFVQTLRTCIDRALAESVDLVLFGGDAFPNATPLPYVQREFATQFRRLADAGIPTVLLVGNHDQQAQGVGGNSLSIYRTLAVPGFIIGDAIATHTIPTAHGPIQIITLPWLNNATLLTKPETAGLAMDEVNQKLIDRLQLVLEAEIRQCDPTLPTVLLAHVMADRATLGAERLLAVGKGFTLPASLFIRPELDYVALGHVHKHQNLNPNNDPPIIYPGSIDRVDFSEEKEEKGYVVVTVTKGSVQWDFCPVEVRPFRTIKLDVSSLDDPQTAIVRAIQKAPITDAVVRLIYQIRPEQLDQVDTKAFHEALAIAHHYSIRPELVSQLVRPRVPELNAARSLDPIEALQTYLDNHESLQTYSKAMLAAAEHLLSAEEGEAIALPLFAQHD
ncbi:exonuclease subunit SbcD [Spirulina major CS-329]|uniref:exonuclease subunit SbcD n=1 Tax=Spirulina TaxID=1154 RepID=UPI00232D589B|nr:MULTISPECIES: exonuclease subunit SbcD [Spirulina]MDB9494198.1 exonuclease subunit SbcD [Spirulina subsalsa CS-330]MDB9504793.1 exonuclease subunit SbcD [Spirulina major CS-329]